MEPAASSFLNSNAKLNEPRGAVHNGREIKLSGLFEVSSLCAGREILLSNYATARRVIGKLVSAVKGENSLQANSVNARSAQLLSCEVFTQFNINYVWYYIL